MSRTVSAVFDGEVFRPTEPLDLPADAEYRLTIDDQPVNGTGQDSLPAKPGVFDDLLELAQDLGLPRDFAAELDHYRFGPTTEKQPIGGLDDEPPLMKYLALAQDLDVPPDLAEQHDHYLHRGGAPPRGASHSGTGNPLWPARRLWAQHNHCLHGEPEP